MNKLGQLPSNTPAKKISKFEQPKNTLNTKELKKKSKDFDVSISDKAKELKRELSATEKVSKIHAKKFGKVTEPAILFVSGFDWFGAGSIKGNYDGISDMAEAVEGAQKFSWDEKSEIIEEIKKRDGAQPVILVGHSFGGDTIVEVANELNTIENGFRTIDLLVTLDSVGFNNDFIPQNVRKNLNFLAQGPYNFLNDGPNIARSYDRTTVKNFLRPEVHSDLDDTTDVQIEILDSIKSIV
ncbi:MAG: hypothetical protein N4A33_07520 [Bacteriovoracaceae bacterium]|jgi:hypothetical protein|nr:hypothetical protein [Bacteriovoracaceae bacterium]